MPLGELGEGAPAAPGGRRGCCPCRQQACPEEALCSRPVSFPTQSHSCTPDDKAQTWERPRDPGTVPPRLGKQASKTKKEQGHVFSCSLPLS